MPSPCCSRGQGFASKTQRSRSLRCERGTNSGPQCASGHPSAITFLTTGSTRGTGRVDRTPVSGRMDGWPILADFGRMVNGRFGKVWAVETVHKPSKNPSDGQRKPLSYYGSIWSSRRMQRDQSTGHQMISFGLSCPIAASTL